MAVLALAGCGGTVSGETSAAGSGGSSGASTGASSGSTGATSTASSGETSSAAASSGSGVPAACNDLSVSGPPVAVKCVNATFGAKPSTIAPGTYVLTAFTTGSNCDGLKDSTFRATLRVQSAQVWEVAYERTNPNQTAEQGTQTFQVDTFPAVADLKQSCSFGAVGLPEDGYGLQSGPGGFNLNPQKANLSLGFVPAK